MFNIDASLPTSEIQGHSLAVVCKICLHDQPQQPNDSEEGIPIRKYMKSYLPKLVSFTISLSKAYAM